jgi:hypothetical protein
MYRNLLVLVSGAPWQFYAEMPAHPSANRQFAGVANCGNFMASTWDFSIG